MGLDGDWWQLDGLDIGGFATKVCYFFKAENKYTNGTDSEKS